MQVAGVGGACPSLVTTVAAPSARLWPKETLGTRWHSSPGLHLPQGMVTGTQRCNEAQMLAHVLVKQAETE